MKNTNTTNRAATTERKSMTLKTGDMLTLNNRPYTITRLDVNAGKVLGAWLSTAPRPDAGGDTIVGSVDGVYLTAAMLRQRLS